MHMTTNKGSIRYSQLTIGERNLIKHGLDNNLSKREIARRIGRSHSTVIREVSRNNSCKLEGYQPGLAQDRASFRPNRASIIDKNHWLLKYIIKGLDKYWSPEQISGRMRLEGRKYYACPETIYIYIYSNKGHKNELYKKLTRRRPKRGGRVSRKRRYIPFHVSIHEREASRTQIGHWEADLMLFGFNGKKTLTTLVERKTRFTRILLNYGKYAQPIMDRIQEYISNLPEKAVQSLTFDCGREFVKHYQLGIPTYFCDPAKPWQKGTNENTNGRIRRFLPKNTKTEEITNEKLDYIMDIINNSPRKCLGFKTPKEVAKSTFS